MQTRYYVFIDTKRVNDADIIKIRVVSDLQYLPLGSYKTFSQSSEDTPEFTEFNRDTTYRKVIL